jgi:molybdopterin synthase sulfur carrier subunit
VAVTVRLFAALREAAGISEVDVAPATLPAIVDGLCARFGEPFTTRVSVASGLVDGQRVALTDDIDVADGSEVALLPPFSGGSAVTPRELQVHRLLAIGSVLVPGLLLLGLLTGRWAYGLVALIVVLGALVDLHTTLARTAVRTILPATALLGVGPPLLLLVAPRSWTAWAGGLVALGVMATFLVALASPRRQDTSSIVGTTMLVAMLVAVGGSALLRLYDLDDVATVSGVLLIVALTDLAVVVAGRPQRPSPASRRLLAAVAVAVPFAVVLFATGPRTANTAVPVLGLAAIAVVAALAGARLRELLRRPAIAEGHPAPALLVGTADAMLFAAPLALLWLRTIAF